MAMLRASIALTLSCAVLPACSSDTAPEPEPTLETPGAFVALDENEGEGPLTLQRTLDTLTLPNDTILIITIYDVDPTSWDEAREASKSHDIPLRVEVELESKTPLVARPHRVVWWRSLTPEEKERSP